MPEEDVTTNVQAISGGNNDVNTSEANAIVRLGDFCTGTLISSDIVLTAAHCVTQPPQTQYNFVGFTLGAGSNLYAATRDYNLITREIYPNWRDIGHAELVVTMTYDGGRLYAATSNYDLIARKIGGQDEDWKRIGHARGVVAMASYGGELYAATSDGNLVARRISEDDEVWKRIGSATNVVGLAAADGAKLYAATRNNGLWVLRLSNLPNSSWTRIGHANEVLAMTSTNDQDSSMLYIITRNGKVWKRHPVDYEEHWQHVDRLAIQTGLNEAVTLSPIGIVAIAAAEGKLYAATTAQRLNVRYLESDWRRIGHARGVVALAASGDKLYAATSDNKLSIRNISESDEAWTLIGDAKVVAMTTYRDRWYAVAKNGNLETRRISEQNEPWTTNGSARNIVAITTAQAIGGIDKLYAVTSNGNLVTRRISDLNENWTRIGHANGGIGLVFIGNKFLLLTGDRHLSIRDIIERDISWQYAEPDRHVAPRIPGKWYDLPNRFAINFGNDSRNFVHRVDAIKYCVPGFADVMLLKLAEPVRPSVARPMNVLLNNPSGTTNPSEFWRRQQFKLVGWGGGTTVRQTTTASGGVFPREGMHGPIMMRLERITGSTQPGDSGSPLIWGNNPQYVIGVCQTNGGDYFVTFSNGGTDSVGLVNPNMGEWLRQFV